MSTLTERLAALGIEVPEVSNVWECISEGHGADTLLHCECCEDFHGECITDYGYALAALVTVVERLKWDREYNAGVAYIAFVAADDMVAKADSADEWMESCRLLASELAALKARRCDTCEHWGNLECPVVEHAESDYVVPPADFCCSRWQEREEQP